MHERVDTTTRAYLDCQRRHRDRAAGPEAGGQERRGQTFPLGIAALRCPRITATPPPDIHPRAKGRWGEEWGLKAVHTPVQELSLKC